MVDFEVKSITLGEQSKVHLSVRNHCQLERRPIDFDCLRRQTLVFLMAGKKTGRLSACVCAVSVV